MVLALVALISGSQEQDATVRETVKDEMVFAMARQMKLDAVDEQPQNQVVLQQVEVQPKQVITKSESQMADDLAFEALEAVQKKYPGHNFLFKNDKKVKHNNVEKKVHSPHFHEPKWLAGNEGSTEKSKKPRKEKTPTAVDTIRMAARVKKDVMAPLPKQTKQKQVKKQKQSERKKQHEEKIARASTSDSLRALQEDTQLAKEQMKAEKEETKALRAKMSNTRQKIYLDEARGAVPVRGEEEFFMQQAPRGKGTAHRSKTASKSIKTVLKRVNKIKAHAKFVKRELRHAKTTVKQAAPHDAKAGKLDLKLSKSVGKTIRKGDKKLYGTKRPMPVMPPIDYEKIGLEEARREMQHEAETVQHIASKAVVRPALPKKHKPKKVVTAAMLSAAITRQADRAAAHALRKAEGKAKDTLLRDLDISHKKERDSKATRKARASKAATPVRTGELAVVGLEVKPKGKTAKTADSVANVAAKVARDSKKVAKAAAKSKKKAEAAKKAAANAKVASVAAKKAAAVAKATVPKKAPKGSMHIATVAKAGAKLAAKIAQVAKANKAQMIKKQKEAKAKQAKKDAKAKKQAQTDAAKAAAAKKKAKHQKAMKKVEANAAAAAKLAKVAAHVAKVAASNGRRRGVMKWNGHAYVKPVPNKVKAKQIMKKENVGARIAKVALKVAKDADKVAKKKAVDAQMAAKEAIATATVTKATAAKLSAKMAKAAAAHATTMLNTEAKVPAAKKLEAIKGEVTRLAHEMPRPADAKRIVMKAAARMLIRRKIQRNVAKRLSHRTGANKAAVAVQTKAKVTVARPPASMDCRSCRARLLASCGRLPSLKTCEKDPRYSQLFLTIRDSCRTYLGLVQLPDGSLSCPTASTHKNKAREQAVVNKSTPGARKVSRAAVKAAPAASKVKGHTLVSSSQSDLHKAVGLMRVSENEEANAMTRAHVTQREKALANKASSVAEDAAEKAFMESFGSPSGEWATATTEAPAFPLP